MKSRARRPCGTPHFATGSTERELSVTDLIVNEEVGGDVGSGGGSEGPSHGGAFARLGRWTATHLRFVALTWLAVLIVFGAFAPKVETALAGAGWQDSSSQSVQARNIIQRDFSGLGAAGLQVVIVDHHGAIGSRPILASRRLSNRNRAQRSLVMAARPSSSLAPQRGRTRWSRRLTPLRVP